MTIAPVVRRVTEGTEGLLASRAHTWNAKLQTLQTLRTCTDGSYAVTHCGLTEGLEGLQVNHPRVRETCHKPSVPSVPRQVFA